MTRPVRLQLSRRKGFDLQALSHATNGLPAIVVSRPRRLGNPFRWREAMQEWGCNAVLAKRWAADAYFELAMLALSDRPNKETAILDCEAIADAKAAIRAELPQLAGKNLACWCKPGEPCHADVLLELANGPGPA